MSIGSKYLVAIGAAVALLLSGQQATAQPSDWNQCDRCGDWEIGAHALYFTPITCPYAYAQAFVTTFFPNLSTANIRAEVIPCRADWGFRLYGSYLNDCLFVGVSYQWFEVTTTRSIVANNLIIHGGQFFGLGSGKATGQVGIEYQNVDVKVGKYLLRGCDSAVYLYGNARWVDLSHRRAVSLFSANGLAQQISEKSQLEGGALGIGFGGEFDLWCNFCAFIDGNILGVIGERSIKDVRYRLFAAPNVTDIREAYPSETCVIPEVDFRIGVNYTYACGCWELVGEIGYEVDYFWQASVLPELTSNMLPQGAREFVPVCEDLGFSGLFFGVRLVL